MGFERLTGFLTRNLSYNCLEELDINNSLKKVLCDHIFFDLNFIIYYCLLELEDEINKIFKLIFSLQFNYIVNIEEKINEFLKEKHWEKVNLDFSNILDGNSELEIINKFKNYLNSKSNNDYPIIYKILYWKIFFKLNKWISNFHNLKLIKSLNIFLDGIPSYSKILEQRRRRSKNYLESNLRRENFKKYFSKIDNDIIEDGYYKYNYFDWLNNKFSINKSIGPTSELTINLEKFLYNKLKLSYKFEIHIDNGINYGESDTKIFKYIHKNNIKDNIVIHTCDSDLIHQIIIQQSYFNINQTNVNLSVIRYYTKNRYGAQLVSSKNIIDLILKKYYENNKVKNDDKTNYKIILDLMFIIYFFGNDIFPSSLEIGYELSLNFFISTHINSLKDKNIIEIIDSKLSLNLINFSKWLKKIKTKDTFTIIILNRFYKLPYNLINFLVDRMNIKLENLLKDFLIPFYTYEGYNNIVIEKKHLEIEDLRYKYYMKYKEDNNDKIPDNPLDVTSIPENYKKMYIQMRESLLKFLDFYSENNYGLQENNRIQLIEENSYQDLYRFVCKKSEKKSINKYKNFYKPYPYDLKKFNEYRKLLNNDKSCVEKYLLKLYYCVKIFFNDMKDYNPCNFLCYDELSCPSIESILNYIPEINVHNLYRIWDKKIKKLQVSRENYFDNVSHHVFITPYLRNSEYINKINNYNMLIKILDEIDVMKNSFWFDNSNSNLNFNYRKIDPLNFLEKWKKILKKISIRNLNLINNDNIEENDIS